METTNEPLTLDSAVEKFMAPEASEEDATPEVEASEAETEEVEAEEPEGEEPEEPEESDEETEEEDPEGDEDSEETDAELYTVKVDGEEVQVSLDDLKRGYSGQQYVQKGMREAAEARKEAESVYEQLSKERQQLTQFFETIQREGFSPPPPEPDKSMFQNDPIGYMEAKLKWDEQVAEYNQKAGQIKEFAQRQSEAEKAALQRYAEQEYRQLVALEPDWGDREKAQTRLTRLVEKGSEHYGYADTEIRGVMDHRAIRVLEDAIKYRELQSAKSKTQEKVQKVTKSKAKRRVDPKRKQLQQQKQRLRKTGSIEDAIGLMMNSDT